MTSSSLNNMSATKLRVILIALIFTLAVIGAVSFWFFRGQLMAYADQVHEANQKAKASDADIVRLQNIEKVLKEDNVAITRAERIVADSQSYKYQDQIIKDITRYAKESGITVTGFVFNESSIPAAADSSTKESTPAGLKSTSVAVSLVSPVSYKNIMRFVHLIERNLTKMQLSGIRLTNQTPQQPEASLATSGLVIEVYTR